MNSTTCVRSRTPFIEGDRLGRTLRRVSAAGRISCIGG